MDTTQINHLSLCSGYGGIDLGLKRVLPSLRTVAYSEIEAFACEVLLARMEGGQLDAAPIWSDLKSFPWAEFSGKVDILSGGFPCQPFSSAGKRAGDEDARHLFPHILEGIRQCRPSVVFLENVEGIISSKLVGDHWNDPAGTPVLLHVLRELERVGYKATAGVFSAAECGASHQRKRVFICAKLAHYSDNRLLQSRHETREAREEKGNAIARGCDNLANSSSEGFQGLRKLEQFGLSQGRKIEERYVAASSGLESSLRVYSKRDAWPSRPGEPQHAWEPPRVVGNARGDGRREDQQGREAEERAAVDWSSEGVEHSNGDRCQRNVSRNASEQDSNGQDDRVSGAADTVGNGNNSECETQPALGLCANESSSVLGETLTLNPYGDSVNAYESLSEKARARQILFEVWSKANTQEVQWTHRGLQCFLAKEILWTGMQLAAFTQRICYFVWCVQTGHPIQGWGLSGMWVYESCRNPSQGQEPIEQFKRELGYAMCQLSYEIALERGQEAVEGAAILQGLREASEGAWVLSDALPEMEEVWRSTLDQKVWENGCYVEAASQGNRTDELRLLGNGVVPSCAAKAFTILMQQISENK